MAENEVEKWPYGIFFKAVHHIIKYLIEIF